LLQLIQNCEAGEQGTRKRHKYVKQGQRSLHINMLALTWLHQFITQLNQQRWSDSIS